MWGKLLIKVYKSRGDRTKRVFNTWGSKAVQKYKLVSEEGYIFGELFVYNFTESGDCTMPVLVRGGDSSQLCLRLREIPPDIQFLRGLSSSQGYVSSCYGDTYLVANMRIRIQQLWGYVSSCYRDTYLVAICYGDTYLVAMGIRIQLLWGYVSSCYGDTYLLAMGIRIQQLWGYVSSCYGDTYLVAMGIRIQLLCSKSSLNGTLQGTLRQSNIEIFNVTN